MELVVALPTELVSVVDPAARGAAPPLCPSAAARESPAAGAPFALLLELLTATPPGEGLPAAGKDLPPDTAELAADPIDSTLAGAYAAPALPLLDSRGLPMLGGPSAAPPPAAVLAAPQPTPLATAQPVLAGPTESATNAPAGPELAATWDLPDLAFATDAPQLPLTADVTEYAATAQQPRSAALRDALFATTGGRPLPPAPVAPPQAPVAPLPDAMAAAPPTVPTADFAVRSARAPQREGPAAPLMVLDASAESVGAPADWLPAIVAPSAHAVGSAAPHAATPLPHAQASVDMRSPTWQDAFAGRIQWLVDTQVGEARIKLNPPELGAVDVKISLVEDKSYVQLTAATPAARDELLNGLSRLRELFTASGLELGGASVESGRAGHHDARGDAATESRPSEPRARRPFAADETRPHGRAAGYIDVFA